MDGGMKADFVTQRESTLYPAAKLQGDGLVKSTSCKQKAVSL